MPQLSHIGTTPFYLTSYKIVTYTTILVTIPYYDLTQLDMVVSSLTLNCKNAIQRFGVNGMQTIQETFRFMLVFFRIIRSQQRITFRNDVLYSESCVKFPGIMIYEKLDWICEWPLWFVNDYVLVDRHCFLMSPFANVPCLKTTIKSLSHVIYLKTDLLTTKGFLTAHLFHLYSDLIWYFRLQQDRIQSIW